MFVLPFAIKIDLDDLARREGRQRDNGTFAPMYMFIAVAPLSFWWMISQTV